METATQEEQSKKIQAIMDRSRELLAQAAKLRERHKQLATQFPQDFEPGVALAWMQENARTNPKAAQALEEFEAWSRSRPDLASNESSSIKSGGAAHGGRRNWQAI